MISWPWDSLVLGKDEETGFPLYDRGYKAEELRAVLMRLFSNGVFDDTPSFVITPGENMSVLVSPGTCFIQGDIGYEASVREIVFTAASSQPRIDTVVLRWDNNIDARSIDLYVHQGVASATPVRPTLTRTESVWELGLADIYIPANTTSISAERITDTRLETARCGIVTPFTSIDTTTFYNQIQAALNKQIGELQDQTDTAVDLAQSALEGTIAGQLQNQIGGKVSKSGDSMTGPLVFSNMESSVAILLRRIIGEKEPYSIIGINDRGDAYINIGHSGADDQNYMTIGEDLTIFDKPIAIMDGSNAIVVSDYVISQNSSGTHSITSNNTSYQYFKFRSGMCIISSHVCVARTSAIQGITYTYPFNLISPPSVSTSGGSTNNQSAHSAYTYASNNNVTTYVSSSSGNYIWADFVIIGKWK